MTNNPNPVPLEEAVRRMVLRQPPTPPAPCDDAPTPNGDDVMDADEEDRE